MLGMRNAIGVLLAGGQGEWLLIFDNAPGLGPVRRFLPPAGNGRVLITSQSAVWPLGQAVEVPVLGTEVAAVFLENVTDPRLVEQVARETGAKVGGTLYSDALTDDKGDATTYIDLIRHNLRQLASALVS